jgi:putative tryptophan/tyrosine transport system substrate-binding protein
MTLTRFYPARTCGVVSFLAAFSLIAALVTLKRTNASGQSSHAVHDYDKQEGLETAQPKRIGLVLLNFPATYASSVAELREGLREHGWIEGKNLVIESRYEEGNPARLEEIATELVRLRVDVLVTAGVPPTLALKKATHTIPIIVVAATDPLGTGLVTPGSNVAAFDILPANAASRQVKVLLEVVPGLSRMAVVWNGSNPAGQLNARRAREAGQAAGLHVIPTEVQDPGQLNAALAGLRDKGAQAIFLVSDPRFNVQEVGALVTATGLPTICQERKWVDGGCVITYGADNLKMFRQSASYVDRILEGTRPADLPIGQPPRFELVINAGSAKTIGLTIPPSILKRADAVIP